MVHIKKKKKKRNQANKMLYVDYILSFFKKAKPVYGERNKCFPGAGGGRELTGSGHKRTFFLKFILLKNS